MKRRRLVVLGIVLGVLGLLVILIWPAAPLWQRMGFTPFCIQGSLTDLKIASCPPTVVPPAVGPLPLPTMSGQEPIPVIVDDDGSPDGVVALLYFLRNPLFDVRAVTVSVGEAHPEVFADHLQRLLAGLGRPDIPVGVGRSMPLEGGNAFPDPWRRASDSFWGVDYPAGPVALEPQLAAELIVETIRDSAEPVMVFVSGTHTNLADALRLDPGIIDSIRDVYVMGGSIYAPGNIHSAWPENDNEVAEWNIWVDPVAAHEVFASGLGIHLVPLDATDKVLWTESDADIWASSTSPASVLAGDLLQMMLDTRTPNGVLVWDLVTAVDATDPALCPERPIALDVLIAPGPEQGRTGIIDGPPNAVACLEPDAARIRSLAAAVLGR